MKGLFTTTAWIAILSVGINAAFFFHPQAVRAAESDFPLYIDDSTFLLKTQTVRGVLYLQLSDIVRNFSLNTNDSTQEIITIRGASSQIVLTRNSPAISINNQVAAMPSPVLRENGVWLVPVEFLQQGVPRVTTAEFRRRAGSPRAFAGRAKPAELTMSAQSQGTLTRLTLRTSTPVTLEMKRDMAQRRAVLVFAPKPIDPVRENVDFKDRLVHSINFNDSDGSPKVVIELSEEVGDIRMLSADENRVHFIDILRKTEVTESAPAAGAPGTAGATAGTRRQDSTATGKALSNVRVIVIDPGHGGIDAGASTTTVLEKDLTLAIARKLRTTLQSRFGATVLLTRDSDVPLTSEARAAVANNNRADLFISLHIGYSTNKADFGSSVYVIQDNFAVSNLPSTERAPRLFLPWYLGYRTHREASMKAAAVLSEELNNSIPGWNFPVRAGPVGVLASAVMPAVLIEVGNLNNPASSQALIDDTFQTRISATVAAAIERFSAPVQATR